MITKIYVLSLLLNILGNSIVASQVTLNDKHVLFALEYVTSDFVPAPFRGEWQLLYYDPVKASASKGTVITYDFSQGQNNDYVISQKISKNGTEAILKFIKSRDDWTFGLYNDVERKKIIDGKYLLDYDKKLPDPPEGILPQEISIQKHVVSYENGDKIYLVIYASKNLDLIKKYHRMPIFQEWGKPKNFWYQSIGG